MDEATVAHDDLVGSEVVFPWSPTGLRPVCPKWLDEPDPCDCGFLGDWERRWVMVWCHKPGHRRLPARVAEDVARGWPGRAGEDGWWGMDGWDERCPGCGDIERFDMDGNEVRRFRVQGVVIPFRPPMGARG